MKRFFTIVFLVLLLSGNAWGLMIKFDFTGHVTSETFNNTNHDFMDDEFWGTIIYEEVNDPFGPPIKGFGKVYTDSSQNDFYLQDFIGDATFLEDPSEFSFDNDMELLLTVSFNDMSFSWGDSFSLNPALRDTGFAVKGIIDTCTRTVVPEPGTLVLFGAGLLIIAVRIRLRRFIFRK